MENEKVEDIILSNVAISMMAIESILITKGIITKDELEEKVKEIQKNLDKE